MLAGRNAVAERLQRSLQVRLRQHRLVRGRRRAKVRHPELGDRLEQLVGSALFDRRACGSEAQWEHRRDSKPEGESHGRTGQEDVAGLRADEMLRERVAWSEHVTMILDAALGYASRAAGEGDDARVVAAGVGGGQRLKRGGARLELPLSVVTIIFDDVLDGVCLVDGLAEVADETAVDDCMGDFRAFDDGRDLARPKQRHGRDDYAAGFEYAEPRGEHRIAIRPA